MLGQIVCPGNAGITIYISVRLALEKNLPRYRDELFSLEFATNILMINIINTAILDINQWNAPESGAVISNFNAYFHN
jgi:hypothetical protein